MMHRSIGSLILALAAAAAACGSGGGSGGPAPAGTRSLEDLAADGEAPEAEAPASSATAPAPAEPARPFTASGRLHPRVSATTASPLELDPPDGPGAAARCE